MRFLISIISTLITVVMFLRMHHIHGRDTAIERTIIVIGTIVFLLQAGLCHQLATTKSYSSKNVFLFFNILFLLLYSLLFFWFVDFDRDSIFSTLMGAKP
jgi:Na+/phosphate symporter